MIAASTNTRPERLPRDLAAPGRTDVLDVDVGGVDARLLGEIATDASRRSPAPPVSEARSGSTTGLAAHDLDLAPSIP